MTATASAMELWRRLALVLGILVGVALFFYVAPAVISATAIDWEQEQAGELGSVRSLATQEKKRLSALPLEEYIQAKTGGKVVAVDSVQWSDFFAQVQLASEGNYGLSLYGDRVSEEDKDDFWKPTGPVPVFFKPDELPYLQWGLQEGDGQTAYISTNNGSGTIYLRLKYHDYQASVGAMYSPYRTAPGWLYHPYRTVGIIVMVLGLLLYILLPRRKNQADDIGYSAGSMVAGDLAGVILFTPFYGLPFLINGGTVQAVTGLWPITLFMWLMSCFAIYLFYINAWYASYRIEFTPQALYLITFKGVREMCFDQMTGVDLVVLRNPRWFRRLFLALAFLSLISGRASSTQPAGSALLADTASYGGLRITGRSVSKPIYIWFSDQMGGVIINNFDRVTEAIEAAGVPFNKEPREIEGFSMFM
ncbi:hypothetical protein SPSYN_01121 [Sporotomaculum syntrophicum]|uniref:Uncharacterized protein n=1 Tax=Sporotomaculum syntrophicum TaxID=182264 RepID=A0A9D3AW55_9FIRM|nr:hypothetical protein [Sporotomaculum syntrophicum]KAF1084985.1 hypothetical protein SPSYN_01121 [Sporotomaculum syntrophicum]